MGIFSKNRFFIAVTLFCTFLTGGASAQWFIKADPLNMLFQNYNAGFERREGRHITGVDVSYLNKGWVWRYEFPGYARGNGMRINIDHKIFFKKAPVVYAGAMIRLEKLYFKEISHWRADYHYSRDDKRLILVGKLGLRLGKGRFKTDFGIGPGIRFLSRRQDLQYTNPPALGQSQEELTAKAESLLAHEPSGFLVKVVPMIHLQTSWRLGRR